MTRKWTTKYGLAAVLTAILIISVALFANPNIMPQQVSATSAFTVMLTDPPTVPAGTTLLNMTYSDIALYIAYDNGTANWVSVDSSGTVNLFSLVNMSQTIASTTIPTNSSVEKIQFSIVTVEAVVNNTLYNVTALSSTLVLQVANSQINQTLSGVLIDFNPTLVQIQATDANGNLVNYYVLVPSATATVVNDLDQAQARVGTIVKLGENHRVRAAQVVEDFSQNITIVSASLSVNGNSTSLSVTLQNQGDVTFRIFGLMLQGKFNSTQNFENQFQWPGNDQRRVEGFYPKNVPFQINGTTLVPLFGKGPVMQPMHPQMGAQSPQFGMGLGLRGMGLQGGARIPFNGADRGMQPAGPLGGVHDDRTGAAASTYLTLEPGQTVTLSFSGVIALQNGENSAENLAMVTTPIIGNSYTIGLSGEGFQTFTVTATS